MTSCERCWWEAQRRGIEYKDMLLIAEREGHPCCQIEDGVLTEQAKRLRAGQFWDEATQSDSRISRHTLSDQRHSSGAP